MPLTKITSGEFQDSSVSFSGIVTAGSFVSGNVGIATTRATQPFQIGAGSTIVIVDGMGDLGIGTTNPTSKLQVVGDARVSGVVTAFDFYNDAEYPSVRPTLDLAFAQTKILDSRITFTRGSTATYVNAIGILTTAAINEPRFDHDPATGESLGLLVEESRTNLLQYSSRFEFDTQTYWNWGNVNPIKIPNYTTSPDGNLTAYQINFGQLTNPQGWANTYLRYYVGGLTNGTTYTFTLYVKSASTSPASNIRVTFNNSQTWTGATSQKFTISNSWQRIQFSRTADSSGVILIHVGAITAVPDFDADCYGNVLIWGGQFEAGSFPTSYVSSLETFTSRASNATFYTSTGTVGIATTNVARSAAFFPDSNGNMISAGLLLEPVGVNTALYSEEFDNGYWIKDRVTVTANSVSAPDGNSTADKMVETATTGEHRIYRNTAISAKIGDPYVLSIFVKSAERSRIQLRIYDTSYKGASFNVSTGSTISVDSGVNAKIEKLANSWYRCSIGITSSAATLLETHFNILNDSNNTSYAGNASNGIHIWGAQLESSSYPTSYIQTTAGISTRAADVSSSATVTRSADVASITGSNFSGWYNGNQGSFVATCDYKRNSIYNIIIEGVGGGTFRDFSLGVGAGNPNFTTRYSYTSIDVYPTGGPISNGTFFKIGGAYSSTGTAASFNGGAVQTTGAATAVATPADAMTLGYRTGGSLYLNGHLSRITYWPTRLSNNILQTITL